MATMTLAIPDELKEEMNKFKFINWSEIARQEFSRQVHNLKIFKKFQSESELTEEDALELGREVRKGISKRYDKL